jgi:hypothetical protein
MFNDLTTITERPPRRWRFWFLFAGLPALIAVLSVGGWLVSISGGLRRAIDEADRLDPGWRLEEIQARRVTPPTGQNGADKIAAIRRLAPGGWPASDKYHFFDDLPSERQLNDQQNSALSEMLAPVGAALAEARSLIGTPQGRYPVAYTPEWFGTNLAAVQEARRAIALLRFDSYAKAQAHDIDAAVRSCHAGFNAGSSIGDEPSVVAQMARIAVQWYAISLVERVIAQGEASDAVLATLQARVEVAEPEPLLLYGLRGDRSGRNQFFDNVRNETLPLGSVVATIGKKPDPALEVQLRIPGYITIQQTDHLRFMNEMVEIAKLRPDEWDVPLAAQRIKEKDLSGLAAAMVGAEINAAEIFRRSHASLRCAIVALAAERHRGRTGHWPATPGELVNAGLLTAVPGDPYAAGQPIKFSHRADGLIVYSAGENGVDEGGDLTKNQRGIGADLGFRLWDVPARRQPPLPPRPKDQP